MRMEAKRAKGPSTFRFHFSLRRLAVMGEGVQTKAVMICLHRTKPRLRR